MGSTSSYCETSERHGINAVYPWTIFVASTILLSGVFYAWYRHFQDKYFTPFYANNKYLTNATVFYHVIIISNGVAALLTTIINYIDYPFCRYEDTIISGHSEVDALNKNSGRDERFLIIWVVYWFCTMILLVKFVLMVWNKDYNQKLVDKLIGAPVIQPQPTIAAPQGMIQYMHIHII